MLFALMFLCALAAMLLIGIGTFISLRDAYWRSGHRETKGVHPHLMAPRSR